MNKNKVISVCLWLAALVICGLGIALTTKASFGVGAVQGPAYAIYLKLSEYIPGFTFGISSYLTEALFLVIMCILIKHFQLSYVLSFVTAFLLGVVLDFFRGILGMEISAGMGIRVLQFSAGTLCIAFAVACYFRTDMPLEVWELFVKKVSEHFGLDTVRFKWFFDICMLFIGGILCIVFFRRFRMDIIGIGTIVSAVTIGPLAGLFGTILDRWIR